LERNLGLGRQAQHDAAFPSLKDFPNLAPQEFGGCKFHSVKGFFEISDRKRDGD